MCYGKSTQIDAGHSCSPSILDIMSDLVVTLNPSSFVKDKLTSITHSCQYTNNTAEEFGEANAEIQYSVVLCLSVGMICAP